MSASLAALNFAVVSFVAGALLPSASAPNHSAEVGESWRAPWSHGHFSERGVPFVHAFGLEPAFLGRDLFLTYGSARGPDENEAELEAELEWALSRRVGMVFEAPLVRLDPDGADSAFGIGDIGAAARVVLIDSARLLLAANLGATLPSGKEEKGLGRGEATVAPSLTAWFDLGNRLQVSAQLGTEHGLETGSREAFFGAALACILATHRAHAATGGDHGHSGAHSLLGVTSGIIELTGRTVLGGFDEGRTSTEILLGLSHNLTGSLEVRGGYQLPMSGSESFDYKIILGLVHHI